MMMMSAFSTWASVTMESATSPLTTLDKLGNTLEEIFENKIGIVKKKSKFRRPKLNTVAKSGGVGDYHPS